MNALVFDFDGVVFDTESPELQSYEELYRLYDVEFPVETWIPSVGGEVVFNAYQYLQDAVERPLNIDSLRRWRRARHWDLVFEQPLCPGVLEYLNEAQTMGLRIGLASSSKAEWVLPLLRRDRLERRFETIITADRVEQVKPDPALYRIALDELGVHPWRSLAIEDSVNGLRAAKAAEMSCLVVPNPVTERLSWPRELEDLRLSSLTEMTLQEVLAILEKKQYNGENYDDPRH